MNPTNFIKKAILSEKAYAQMEKGIYTFLVDKAATKDQIARAIEKQFSVSVAKVNVLGKSFKKKRILRSRKEVKTGGGKKAIVWLGTGQSIAMLLPKTKESKAKIKKAKDRGLLGKIKKAKNKEEEER